MLVLVFGAQLVWATSSRIGCAINVCYNMNVWGMIWAKAVYLVCNYSPPYVSLQPSHSSEHTPTPSETLRQVPVPEPRWQIQPANHTETGTNHEAQQASQGTAGCVPVWDNNG